MFAPRVCFIDVETTGSSPVRERLIEVGIVTVDTDGDQLRVSEWSSLINPGVPIPGEIQWLTRITNEMVRAAPTFAAIAAELADRLRDAIFVAHNARFDYGFLKAAFARCDIAWRMPLLCTVRLSRLLYPDRAPHSLDSIVERFNLYGEQRHRALGDARVLWRFVQRLYERLPRSDVEQAIERLLARPSTPPALPPDAFDDVPHAPGVYLLYGLNAHPIYIGKSIDMRERLAGHFNADHASATDARLSQEVRRVEWEERAGELGALLREAELIKSRLPAHNIALRRRANQVVLALGDDDRPRFIPAAKTPLDQLATSYGPFSSRVSARRFLLELAREHALCPKVIGLERPRRAVEPAPCFNFQVKKCAGACVGVEPLADHGARLRERLAPMRVEPWPRAGAVAVIERNDVRLREDVHVFDRWCWLGTVRTLAAAAELAASAPRVFEADTYRIARSAFARNDMEVLPLERNDE